MTTINNLSSSDPSLSDSLPIFSVANGDQRKTSLNSVLSLFKSNFASPDVITQHITPTTGFNAAVASSASPTWLLIQPASTLASGTITLPNSPTDGIELIVSSTQAITALSVSLNGALAANGAPTTLAANGFFRLRYYKTFNTWYRIG